MTTKEWLKRAGTINKEIDALLEAQYKAFIRCTSTTSALRDVVVSGGGTDRDSKLAAYAALSKDIDNLVDQLIEIKREILSTIYKISDGTLRTLLISRYINIKEWNDVAKDIGYEVRSTARLRSDALSLLTECCPEMSLNVSE
ncbi:MAG: hypothetical protein CVU91_08485 [Firmicutes bacterium HGW-Firmicutes-16]|nr:MAG: hypothetical protein CVU91_08485 [Firmicutes bacterium HGW-Firmicutes-16]